MSARSFAKVKIGWVFSDCFRRKGFVTFAAFFLPVFQNNAYFCRASSKLKMESIPHRFEECIQTEETVGRRIEEVEKSAKEK